MFKELVFIELDKDGAAGWDPKTGNIAIDIPAAMGERIGMSIEGTVDTINNLFLTEFICMDIVKNTEGIIDCKKCMPLIAALEMMIIND